MVNKLYTLATSTLSLDGKTRVLQRNDLLKVPLDTSRTVFFFEKIKCLNRLKSAGGTVRKLYIEAIVIKTTKSSSKQKMFHSEARQS